MSYFLMLEGFVGKSYDARRLGAIELNSVSSGDYGVSVSKKCDQDSFKIITALMEAQIFPSGKIISDSMEDMLGFEMINVSINSYQKSETMESFSLDFESIN